MRCRTDDDENNNFDKKIQITSWVRKIVLLLLVALVQLSYPPHFLPVIYPFYMTMVNAGLKAFWLGPELLTI